MSRGLGKLQKQIVEILKGGMWTSLLEILYQIYDPEYSNTFLMYNISNAKKQSIYRAVRTLQKRGLVESRIREHGVAIIAEAVATLGKIPEEGRGIGAIVLSSPQSARYSYVYGAKHWKEIRLT